VFFKHKMIINVLSVRQVVYLICPTQAIGDPPELLYLVVETLDSYFYTLKFKSLMEDRFI
jgi:hypothetical protein